MIDKIIAIAVIVALVLGSLLTFYIVDKPRKSVTLGSAFFSVAESAVIIYLLVKAYL